MKTFLIIFLLLTSTAFAKRGNFGLGVIIGEPTALSAKYFMGGNDAIDGGLSFDDHEIIVYGDYLRHFPGKLGKQNAFVSALNPYIGVGPVFAFGDNDHKHKHGHDFIDDEDDDFAFGGRIPFGVEWVAPEFPVGVSLEVVPGIVIIPETDAFVQGGLAVRYYF